MEPVEQRRLLVADNDPVIRGTLVELLTAEGYQVAAAADGPAVLAAVEQQPPDLLLLDVRMPGASGMEVLAKLPAGDERPDVIIITAFGIATEAIKVIQAGAYGYSAKPFNLDEALRQAARLLDLEPAALRERLDALGLAPATADELGG